MTELVYPLWHAVEEAIYATLVRITAPESKGVSLRDTAGLLTGTIASLVGAVEKAQYEPNRSPVQYLPLSEVTDGHVDAYLKAYMQQNKQGIIYREAVRAGLAAIQWPSREVQATPETREVSTEEAVIAYVKLVADSLYRRLDGITNQVRVLVESMPVAAPPEMRGLPVNRFHELRPGDLLSGIWSEYGPKSDVPAMPFAESGSGWLINPVITRPVSPRFAKPGAVGTATVRGTKDVAVFRTDDGNGPPHWTSAVLVEGHRWHEDSDLTDYESLLDGEKGNR